MPLGAAAAPPLPLVMLVLAAAVGAGAGVGLGAGPGPGAPPPGGGHNSTAIKDLGLSFNPFSRGLDLDGAIAAVFNKVAYGTTAAPTTTRLPTTPTTTSSTPSTTRTPPTTARPTAAPPPPTEQQVPLPPPQQPPLGAPGVPPTRRTSAHPLPEYPPPNRPPPLPAEYNPFANKAILRGSQSDVGSSGPGRKAPPTLLQPRPPPSELIPLPPVNTPSQGPGGPSRGHGPGPTPEPRPERPAGLGRSSGKHHLDAHIHTVASAPAPPPAPAPALAPAPRGHQHVPHLKAAKPTELLDQVNKDPYIGVQAEGAVESDAAITLDEDNSAKVQVPLVTSPPPAQRPAGGPGAAGDSDWHVMWTGQTYALGSLWGALAVMCLLAVVWINSRTRLLPRSHFVLLLALLIALAAINSFSLFYDVLCDPAMDPALPGLAGDVRVPQLLADISLPLLPAAFAIFFFVIVRVSHVSCGSSRLHSLGVLATLVLFLVVCTSLEGVSWALSRLGFLHVVAQTVWVCSAALLGLAYACLYRPLRRAAAKKQAEQLRAAFTAFRRPPSPALPQVVNALLACAVLLLFLAAMHMYRLVDAHLLVSPRDWRSPPWWYLLMVEHGTAFTIGFLLLWGATRGPSRCSDERSSTSRSSRGTPGALSLVSCAGKRFLFDCPSTGSEENKNSEDNNFPAVCASNHAILNYTQHTGNKLYDDSFPLANLPSAPQCNAGDDFSNVPTMPKRRPAQHKSGTLIPATHHVKDKSRHAHHTLGPGGQLYDDALLRYERGSRTTGRTRKARHNKYATRDDMYSNCPQDDDYKLDGLDGLADDFQVFKQYASTGSSESADNYDVPMLMSVPQVADREAGGSSNHNNNNVNNKRLRRRLERGDSEEARPLHRGGGAGDRRGRHAHHDSLSPASPSDLSDCDRFSSNRSSYDEMSGGPVRPVQHRGKALLRDRDVSEDDVTPDSAVVADITASSHHNHHSPREKRAARDAKRLARRQHRDSPSSPELVDMRSYNSESVWSPQ